MDTTSSPKPPSGRNADRYVPMLLSERTLHELYGLHEALEDFLEAATDPVFTVFHDLPAGAWHAAATEYRAARDVVVEVVIPTVFTLGDEEYNLNHRYLTTGDEEALLQLSLLMFDRVEARIHMYESSPATSRAPSVPAAQ